VVPWPGCFDIYHQPPVIKTNLPEGARLRVSYYHVVTISHKGAPVPLPTGVACRVTASASFSAR
jgi:hypothetical protein